MGPQGLGKNRRAAFDWVQLLPNSQSAQVSGEPRPQSETQISKEKTDATFGAWMYNRLRLGRPNGTLGPFEGQRIGCEYAATMLCDQEDTLTLGYSDPCMGVYIVCWRCSPD